MDLQQLMERGGFVPPTLTKRKVTWCEAKDGPATFDIWVKEPSAAAMERVGRGVNDAGEQAEDIARRPLMVSLCVFFDEGGKNGFTYEQACSLKHSLCTALYEAVADVMQLGAEAAKNSLPPTSSGTSSSSMESAAGQ